MSDQDIIIALQSVSTKYGKPFAARLEQLFRNETRHFTSGNFIRTLSPGMEATAAVLPFGWNSLAQFWKENPQYAPTSLFSQVDNNSALSGSTGMQHFLVFPNILASMMSVAKKIEINGGDAGTWFDNVKADQQHYDAVLDTIIPRFVNANIK